MASILAVLGKAAKSAPGGKPDAEEAAEPKGMDESSEDPGQEYGDELASMLGVAPDDKADFLTALRGYVMACSGGGS